MQGHCELLEKCGFFINFKANSEVTKQGWIGMYCDSREKSDRCVRKKIRQLTGSPPPDAMAPTGEMINTVKIKAS